MVIRKMLVATLLAGGAVVAGLSTAAPAHAAPNLPCGYFQDGDGYWHNCDVVPQRVHVIYYDSDKYICVDAGTVRDLGWVGADWGGLMGANQAGRCPR